MPQLIIEYSDNIKALDESALLLSLNQRLIQTGLVVGKDLKSRIHANHRFLIGLGDQQQAYVHAHLYILNGRSLAEKKLLADQVFAALQQFDYGQGLGLDLQLCVELTEMPIDDYRKAVVQI